MAMASGLRALVLGGLLPDDIVVDHIIMTRYSKRLPYIIIMPRGVAARGIR